MHGLGECQSGDPRPAAQVAREVVDRRDAHRAIAVSAAGLGVAGLIELAIAALSGSVGLLSDALHNLADVSTSLVVFLGLRVSRRPASASHPFGWERAEDVAGLGVALAIWVSAAFAAYLSVHKLFIHGTTTDVGWGIVAAAVGVLGNQVVARYKLRVGRRIQSATLVADAQHSWLDALSSAGAMIGLIGVAVGWSWADAVAGLLVTGFICHVGYEVTSELVRHLMDAVEPRVIEAAAAAAAGVDGVEHVHVRARWMGRTLLVEVDGYVTRATTVAAAEVTGRAVEAAVRDAVPEARAVRFSVRPFD
ncbi:MAG: cation transporter [Actinomycetales bacterium]|nr:cation transporter [Actinomycetales bacterium]